MEFPAMLGELIPQGGGDTIPLLKSRLRIGRRDDCDIALRFPNVSSRHCELELLEGYWQVRDLGSSNGTKVNGVRIVAQWLMPGDELAVAKHRFRIEYYVSPTAAPPPPIVHEVDLGTSLLEKAGLEHPRREPPASKDRTRSAPGARPASSPNNGNPDNDEDRALEWLEGED
jgi:predicted component of type VI protein secretion system